MYAEPLVSIIIPTYNRRDIISATLNSVAAQTYQNWECLVVDDFSKDETNVLVEEYTKRDSRFKYFLNSRGKGAQGARNTGILHSNGSYIQFFDSDDVMYPNLLTAKIELFNQKPDVDIVTSFSHLINTKHEVVGIFAWITQGNIFEKLLAKTTYVDTNSALIKKEFFQDFLLDENVVSFQELDMHLSLSKNANYGMVWEFLTGYYRRETDTISSDSTREKQGEIYNLLKFKKEYLEVIGIKQFRKRVFKCLNSNAEILNYIAKVFPGEKDWILSIMKTERRSQLFQKIKSKIYHAI